MQDTIFTTDNLISAVDIFGVKGIVSSCSDVSKDGGLGCAKGWMGAAAVFDPTGLLTIATAFMQPHCPSGLSQTSLDIESESELNA